MATITFNIWLFVLLCVGAALGLFIIGVIACIFIFSRNLSKAEADYYADKFEEEQARQLAEEIYGKSDTNN